MGQKGKELFLLHVRFRIWVPFIIDGTGGTVRFPSAIKTLGESPVAKLVGGGGVGVFPRIVGITHEVTTTR